MTTRAMMRTRWWCCWWMVINATLGHRLPRDRGMVLLAPSQTTQHQWRAATPLITHYKVGNSEEDLPICSPRAVCSKIDLYDESQPRIERQCRCAGHHACRSNLSSDDGHTLVDKTLHYKLCEPVKKLSKCRNFTEPTWTIVNNPETNSSVQIVHCHCPKNSITYLQHMQTFGTSTGRINKYSFACSPQGLWCSLKEPCRVFKVRKRQEALEEVNTNTPCQCPRSYVCPRRHTSIGVLPGKTYAKELIRAYSGYCMPIALMASERRA